MEFTKMHGLGNDFIMIEGDPGAEIDYAALAVRLCDRHTGIGADGILIALPSSRAEIKMRIINGDGSEAAMCGNGIRCFAKYAYERGLVKKERFAVETGAGLIHPELLLDGGRVESVRVNMGRPVLERSEIPMAGPPGRVVGEELSVNGVTYRITSLLMGVPHTVIFLDSLEGLEIAKIGPGIEKSAAFPKRTNVNFVTVTNDREIAVRTWERGAGPTLACGTGSCASVVASVLNGKTGRRVTVHLVLGDLEIEWAEDDLVYMTGPAAEVFHGEIEL